MGVTESKISHYAKRYYEATGSFPKRFVCPITLEDDPNAALCDGHILCEKLKSAGKQTVLQREDVDNRFGSFIERDFVRFANFRGAKPHEILSAAGEFKITSPSGVKIQAFFAGDKAKLRFQQVEMYDDNGKTVATPFLRSHTLDAGIHKSLQVEWMLYIHKFCFAAAFLKSAYLNLFRLFGYTWVFDIAGDKVRRTLAASFHSSDRKTALDQFADFDGCCWITGTDTDDGSADSLTDDRLLFHYGEGDAQNGLLFGISCIFRLNNLLTAVTVPACNKEGHFFVSWNHYRHFIATHDISHSIHFGRIIDGVITIGPTPLRFHKVDALPPTPPL